ncbi:MAG: hypothetical protein C0392_00225 [Syntrophus sp. (in: bacteria)]|nr:hypothetical protein [Syntrophus sp. (in: bacteria)]
MEHDECNEGRRRALRKFFKNPANLRYNLNTIIPIVVFLTSILSAIVADRAPESLQTRLPWVLGIALFSAFCSFLVVAAMTQPVKTLMGKAEKLIRLEESRKEKGQMIEVYQLIERLMEYAGEKILKSDNRDKAIMADVGRLDYIIPLGYMSLMVAHEVRNPLSTITGMTELLKEKVVDATQMAYLERILEAAKKIDSFTNELLDFTDNDFIKDIFDVNKVIEEVVETLSLEIPGVTCEHVKQEDVIYIGDGQKIQQALHNIMRNAFQLESKAPGLGFVKVEAELGEALIIKVYNRNSRIDIEDRENIFKPFFSKKKGGRGIGLFIAARNVSLHGGEIMTESDESGTTFIIKLPMTQGLES